MTRQELFDWIKEKFGAEPEYLWSKFPQYAVFRNPDNKWFAIVMDVPKSKFGIAGEETAEVLNVKADSMLIEILLGQQICGFSITPAEQILNGQRNPYDLRNEINNNEISMNKKKKKSNTSGSSSSGSKSHGFVGSEDEWEDYDDYMDDYEYWEHKDVDDEDDWEDDWDEDE